MNVQLSAEQRALAHRAITDGRLLNEEEAVQEALALWEERERRRLAMQASLDEAKAAVLRAEGRQINPDSMRSLAAEVAERGRARLATELLRVS
jgi:Arc/MetJ-type ribon-helix-helix transcriptional regulator